MRRTVRLDLPAVALTLALTLILNLAGAAPLAAQYTFLGAMRSYDRTESGATFQCAPGATLALRFLTPRMVRVTLDRDDHPTPLLDDPIARSDWPPVPVRYAEETGEVVVASDALVVAVSQEACRVAMRTPDGRVITRDDPGMGIGWEGSEVRNWKVLHQDEHFYGLGEKTGALDKAGEEWTMWNSDTFAYTAGTDPVYESIPFFIGIRDGQAYGTYFNNSYRTTFNFGAGNQRYTSFAAPDGALDYFFIQGPAVPDVVEAYTELTGRYPMPPRWALGYQQSRWSYFPQAEVLRIARTFREKRLPADVLYLDIHYMDGYRVFTWDRERFPDPEGMLAELEAMGFKVVTIIDPGVKVDSAYAVAREGLRDDLFVHYPDDEVFIGSVWPGPSYFPDFSQDDTREWWADHLAGMAAEGIDGFWNDMNEPAVWGKAFPLEVLMDDGGRHSTMKKMHNLYGLLMAEGTYEGLLRRPPDRRPFVLTRAGFSGIQRYAAVWTGDNIASWEHLQLGVRMLLGMGISGIPFVGTDVGGFVDSPSPELFARWMELGVFAPLYRAHTTANTLDQEPWSFGEYVEDVNRQTLETRYRLIPYLYSLLWQAHETGAPVLRPLFWHHQGDDAVYDPQWQHEFTVGPDLLAAPVLAQGQTLQRVYLPAGSRWVDLDSGTAYDGGQEIVVDAPLERIPMFLREGGALVRGPVAQSTGELPDGPLTVDLFATSGEGGRGTGSAGNAAAGAQARGFTFYQDDGASLAYRDGDYRLTRLAATRDGAATRVVREVLHDGYDVASGIAEFRIHDIAAAPSAVTLDGRSLAPTSTPGQDGYRYDERSHTLVVWFEATGDRQELTVR